MIVVDADVVACLYLPGEHTAKGEFIALAKRLQTRLVTLDAKLLKAFPQHAVSLAAC